MCNLYQSTPRDQLPAAFAGIVQRVDGPEYAHVIAPLKLGPFITKRGQATVGQWGMIPPNSKTRIPMTAQGKRMSTNNARFEGVPKSWTFRFAWARGQRCLIPAQSYNEPYWGAGRNIWWRFSRADGTPWTLAGLWSEWTDLATGEVFPNYTLLTQNCDGHPLLGLMHKPDPKLPPNAQDKRSVVPIEAGSWDTWLNGNVDQATALVRVPRLEIFKHGAADPAQQVDLPMVNG